MITNLIPLSTFVLMPNEGMIPHIHSRQDIINYAHFLQQKTTLNMFIACVDGVPVSEPKKENYSEEDLKNTEMGYDYLEYQQAQDNVLFAGFSVVNPIMEKSTFVSNIETIIYFNPIGDCYINGVRFRTIENLLRFGLPLTPKAQNLIYGK